MLSLNGREKPKSGVSPQNCFVVITYTALGPGSVFDGKLVKGQQMNVLPLFVSFQFQMPYIFSAIFIEYDL